MILGVIDIGTNSIHMLVVRVDADLRYHVIDRAKDMVRLGEGSYATGRLDEGAQARAIEALTRFHRLAQRRGVERFVAVATSAVREAENGGAFLQEVYRQTGIHPRVIAGPEEARIVFRAVQAELPLDERPVLVVDLGGGSAEVALGSLRQVAWTTSLPLGVQRLEALSMRDGRMDDESHASLRSRLQEALAPVAQRAATAKIATCHVTSGSANSVLRLLRARGDVGAGEVVMSAEALVALDESLRSTKRREREAMPGVEPARVDILVPAVTFFRTLVEALGLPGLVVSDQGLREGLVLDFIDRHASELQWELTEPNARRRSVLRFCERLRYDASHAHHVAQLAIVLFDGTRDLHGLDERSRELLEYAALVHDVGYLVEEKSHHKHTEYLVLHGLIGPFSEVERRIVAAIARYHRKSQPKARHDNWAALDPDDQELVAKAAAILRIADGLDRSHARAVQRLGVEVQPGGVVALTVASDGPVDLEVWAARKKSDMFARVFAQEVQFGLSGDTQPLALEEVTHGAQ